MRIVKPFTLGFLPKPYRHRQGHHYVVTAFGFFRLGIETERFLTEQSQWPVALKALPANEPLDLAMPKARAEMLLAGSAYAPAGKPVARMTVRASLGPIDKRLNVLGDREWMYGLVPFYRITPPAPFAVMPLGYERAYGGPAYAANPLGRGYTGRRLAAFFGDNHGPMPNLERPGEPVRSHRKRYAPAGFGPLDIRSPVRQARAGTYDRKWLEHDAPGLPDDVQWTLYNAAPEDQQTEGYFAGGEPYRLEGMHPSKPVIEGRLPQMRVRAFVQRCGRAPDTAEELAVVFDTVWFFPDQELGVAVYRAQTEIEDSDALDVETVMLAYEHAADAPRPVAHYREALRLRTDPAVAALHMANEAPLLPEIEPAARAAATARRAQKEADQLARQQASLDEATAEFWAQSGMSPPADYTPPKAQPLPLPVVTAEEVANGEVDLTEIAAKADALAKEAQAQADAKRAEAERLQASVDKPPVSPEEQIKEAEARAAVVAYDLVGGQLPAVFPALSSSLASGEGPGRGQSAEVNAQVQAAMAQLPALERQTRRLAPEAIAPAVPLLPETALHLGRKVREWHAAGVCLAGRDLAGARLPRADFTGADLREVMFEQADLTGASFRGANLHGAVFTGARLAGADFSDADLTGANLSHSEAAGAVFRNARLGNAFVLKANWAGADLSGAVLTDFVGREMDLTGANLDRTDLTQAVLIDPAAGDACLRGARLNRTTLVGPRLAGADLSGADIERSVLLNARAEGSRWRGARLKRLQTGGTAASFAQADFREVEARECGWRGVDLSRADLSGARFVVCDFGQSRLDGARLRGALLWRSIFMQATLLDCDAAGADFFQAMCRKADFRGASLDGANRAQADFSEALFGEHEPERTRAVA